MPPEDFQVMPFEGENPLTGNWGNILTLMNAQAFLIVIMV